MRKVYVIAGHQGRSTGAIGIINEGEETINLRNRVVEILADKGIEAVIDDDKTRLGDVVRMINNTCKPTDICIDIHFNACNGKANGSEVIYQNYPTNTEIELAEDMLNATTMTLGTKNRGVKKESQSHHTRLAMLSGVKCNSVLIEVCFCDNPDDSKKYEENKEELAYAYAEYLKRFAIN